MRSFIISGCVFILIIIGIPLNYESLIFVQSLVSIFIYRLFDGKAEKCSDFENAML